MIFKTITDENGDTNIVLAKKAAQDELNASLLEQTKVLEQDEICLKAYEDACSQGTVTTETFNKLMDGASDGAKAYAVETKGAAGSTEVFVAKQKAAQASLRGTATTVKASSIVMKAFSVVLNTVVTSLISLGVSLLVSKIFKGFDKLIHKSKYEAQALEEMASKAEEAKSNIESLTSSMSKNIKTVNESKKRYAELSQGVDNLSNKNLTLSTSEYEEFLDLTNQLSEVFPQLNRGIDDNGNAILNLNGDVNTITSSLEGLLDVEKELANQEIAKNAGEYISNSLPQLEKGYNDLQKMKDEYKSYKEQLDQIYDVSGILYNRFGGETNPNNKTFSSNEYVDYTNIKKILSDIGIDVNKEIVQRGEADQWIYSVISFSEEDKKAIELYYSEYVTTTETEIKKSEAELARANQQLSSMASYWYTSELSLKDQSGKSIYDNLQNSDLQNAIQQMLNDVNWAELQVANNWSSDQDVYNYISDNILIPLENVEPKIRDSVYNNIIKAFTDTTLSQNDKLELLKNLQQQLSDLGIEIDLSFKIDEIESKNDILKNRLGYEDVGTVSSSREAEIVNKNLEIDNFVDSLNDEDRKLLLDADIPDSVKNGVRKDWENFLKELKKKSKLDIDVDPVKPLSEMKSAFSDFESIYDDIHNSSFVASDAIEKLSDAFGDLTLEDGTNALQEFKDILTTMPDDVEAQQKALERLGTIYLDNSDLLKNLNESNKEYTIRQLEAIGVTNAKEVVDDRLNNKEKLLLDTQLSLEKSQNVLNILADTTAAKQANVADETERAAIAKRASELASIDLENASITEIAQLIAEANNAGIDATALGNLASVKLASNKVAITTDGDIKNLAELADQLSGTSEATYYYGKLKEAIDNNWYNLIPVYEGKVKDAALRAQWNAGKNVNTAIEFTPPNTNTGGGSSSNSEKEFEETIDWIEIKIQRIQEEISRLDKTAGNTYDKWINRNEALSSKISKVTEEISIQKKAYDRYIKEANAVDLSETYKSKVRNGSLDIETITDEDLRSKITEYQEWYNKAIACSDAIQDLNINLSELAEQKFNNVKSEYEGLISLIESSASLIDAKLSNIETRGYFANSKYYENLRTLEQEKYSDLYKEYDELTKKFNDAVSTKKIKENSEAWVNMKNEISNVEKSLIECNTQIVELNKNIRDLNWEKFDYAEERINQITDEANFLIDLLDRDSLYEDDGKFNDEGMATLGLRGVNYNTYMQQSRYYANELIEINKDLAKDPYNKELIARREELLKLQQDAISNAESEKDAIKSLVQEGINLHLESLSKIIDKYKESLSAAKDLYDYQKNLADQTKEIANLEKIMMAYSGDDSEGTRKIVQETKLKLEEAKTNLQETQWDRYISDTEKLLDDLYNDYSEVLNARLDDTNALVKDVIGDINSNSKDIQSTINSVSKDVGYTLSDNFNKVINGNKDIASTYIDGIAKTTTNIYDVINKILNFVSNMSTTMDGWLKNTDGSWSYMKNGFETKNGWVKSNNKWYHFDENGIMESSKWIKNSNGKWSYVDANGQSVSGWKQIKYQGKDTWFNFDKDGYLKTDAWIGNYFVDKNGVMKTSTWIGHNGKYYWVGKDGKWQDLPGWSKDKKPNDGYPLYEYAKGSKYIGKDQLAWTQEEGTEIIYRTKDGAMLTPLGQGDKVYTKDMSDVLWNFAKANVGNSFSTTRSIPNNIQKSDIGSVVNNDNAISITLPNVKNYAEFKHDLQNDSKFQSFVQDITVGQMLGKGKLNKNKYM